MARIGLQTWGSEGDVQPFLALAGGLAEAGHDVRLVMTTQADKAYEVPPGVTLERAGPDVYGEEGAALIGRVIGIRSPLKQARLMVEEGFEPYAAAMREAAEELVASSDLVVRHHFLYMTQAVAEKAGVPEVSVYLTPDLLPTRAHPPTGMPSLGPLQGLAWWLTDKGISSVFLEPAKRLRAEMGLPRARGMLRDVWPSSLANLVAVSPALFPRPADWPEHLHLTGFMRGPIASSAAIDPELEAFLEDGEPPLYAAFGSLSPYAEPRLTETARLFVEAARAVGRRVVIQLPVDPDVEADDALVVRGSPHARVFGRCAAVIHHGGAGVTQTAIRAGARSVVVPHFADQLFWAAQAERLGVSVAAPPRAKVTAKTLARAIERALALDAGDRLRELAAALDAEEGVRSACAAVEGALRAR